MNFSVEIMTQREQPWDRQLPRSDICLTLQTSSGRKRVPPRKTCDSRFRARSASRRHSMRHAGLELQGELGFLPCLEYVGKKNHKNQTSSPLLFCWFLPWSDSFIANYKQSHYKISSPTSEFVTCDNHLSVSQQFTCTPILQTLNSAHNRSNN